jgi:hypothetical protein
VKHTLVVMLAGLVAGVAGAAMFEHWKGGSTPPIPPPVRRPLAMAPAITPPGWDPQFGPRLARLETEIADVRKRPSGEGGDPVAPPAGGVAAEAERKHALEREQHYRDELESQSRRLAEHAQEPLDTAWAEDQTHRLREELMGQAGAEPAYAIKSVDCRNSTCVGQLTFPSPGLALAYLRDSATRKPVGCLGVISTPTPPADDGPYDLTLVYRCR